MTRLQRLPAGDERFFVTLGGAAHIPPSRCSRACRTSTRRTHRSRSRCSADCQLSPGRALHTPAPTTAGASTRTGRCPVFEPLPRWGDVVTSEAVPVRPSHLRQRTTGLVPGPSTVPALYETTVRHVRTAPFRNTFSYASSMWLVDVDDTDLPSLARPLRALARFKARDHLGDPPPQPAPEHRALPCRQRYRPCRRPRPAADQSPLARPRLQLAVGLVVPPRPLLSASAGRGSASGRAACVINRPRRCPQTGVQ